MKWLTLWKCNKRPVCLAHRGIHPLPILPEQVTHTTVSEKVCNYLKKTKQQQISALWGWSLSLIEASTACQLARRVLTSSGIRTLWSWCADESDNQQFDICGWEWSRLNNWGCQHASMTIEKHLESLTEQEAQHSSTFSQSHSVPLPELKLLC